MRENDFLSWLSGTVPAHPAVPVGIGDDMAVVRLGAGEALLKIDQCMDRVHVDLRKHTPRDIGVKAVNRCLSDCAAMACRPVSLMISLALPRDGDETLAREVFAGCQAAAAVFNCPIVGGDTGIWDQRLVVTVAALGEMPKGRPPVCRSGARPGDALIVSGELGGSLLWRQGHHMTFVPRIELAQALASKVALHAMMDLSDGLAMDLPRLCAASKVGAMVAGPQLPISPAAERLAARDHLPAGLHALMDGEDYELLFAVAESDLPTLFPAPGAEPFGVRLTRIGTVSEEQNLVLLDANDQQHPWPQGGYEHQ
jgi:thiamine-monophosphate kinase